MKVLVTGGAGFIGSHVVEALLSRHDVVTVVDDFFDPALKKRNISAVADRVHIVQADIREPASFRACFEESRFDAVVHLAAQAGVRPSILRPLLYTDVNVVGTQRVLELCREFKVNKFVFASSSSVYGSSRIVPFREDFAPLPISPYAATKLAGEGLCHVYHHLFGMDIICLRFFTVYGPRQRPDLAIHKFTKAILHDQPLEVYGDGTSRRDYTHIDDILQGILASIDRKIAFEIINLGESRTVELQELVGLIEREAGKKAQIVRRPDQPGDVPITYADISKARRLLGYNPQVSIEGGIRQFVEWFRNQPGTVTG